MCSNDMIIMIILMISNVYESINIMINNECK